MRDTVSHQKTLKAAETCADEFGAKVVSPDERVFIVPPNFGTNDGFLEGSEISGKIKDNNPGMFSSRIGSKTDDWGGALEGP